MIFWPSEVVASARKVHCDAWAVLPSSFICAFTLDNTIPGTPEERGMQIWDKVKFVDVNNDPEYVQVYSLPLCFAKLFRNCDIPNFQLLDDFRSPLVMAIRVVGAMPASCSVLACTVTFRVKTPLARPWKPRMTRRSKRLVPKGNNFDS